MRPFGILVAGSLLLAACGGENAAEPAENPAQKTAAGSAEKVDALAAAIAGDHRSDEAKARDIYRHPKETLQFFGIEADDKVVEIWPGGGWYTEIIAPYLKSGGGVYYAAGFSPEGANERVLEALTTFRTNYVEKPEIYGTVEMTVLGDGGEIAPAGTADAVLTFRNVHNWIGRGATEEYFQSFYRALKPGGVLGVVEHRADGADLPRDGSSGYVYVDDVIAMANAAGFELDAASEVNTNPADTKDHPFGVWTLKPVRRSSAARGVEDPDFDRAAYDAIGESDRMTLRFRKPIAADGALLE